ncbi:hypothetical protein K438DRAFT_1947481 [Mycena galopus ATCC 62051]|nr:hypothetical protein K438DRAFT_1947481 [Mycena galopus ATCC 62051]
MQAALHGKAYPTTTLPGTLSLRLWFPGDTSNLLCQWQNLPDDDDAVEAQLHRVAYLLAGNLIRTVESFGTENLRTLPRWLRLFPALTSVLTLRAQLTVREWERVKLLKAIREACPGVEDVSF